MKILHLKETENEIRIRVYSDNDYICVYYGTSYTIEKNTVFVYQKGQVTGMIHNLDLILRPDDLK